MNFRLKQEEKKQQNKASAKRKREQEAIDKLNMKKICLEGDIKGLAESVVYYAERCEKSRNIDDLIKSNSLRRTKEEKVKELEELKAEIASHSSK